MKPKILLTAGINDFGDASILGAYSHAIEASGGLPFVLPYIDDKRALEEIIDTCDGVFLTGGADVSPRLYGEEARDTCGQIQEKRDELEMRVLEIAARMDKPILAVCRGIQLVNVFFGGSLYQDVPTECPTEISHVQGEPKHAPSHEILIFDGTPLRALVKKDVMAGNSFHHQAIKRLGDGLRIMAEASDKTVEAVFASRMKYLRAYQWHPERLYCTDICNKLIFNDFIKACEEMK